VDLEVMGALYLIDLESKRMVILVDITEFNKKMVDFQAEFKNKKTRVSRSRISELVWVDGNKITEIISKKLTIVSSDLRGHIRDISKIIPVINVDRCDEIQLV
jgi:hypothetical protein